MRIAVIPVKCRPTTAALNSATLPKWSLVLRFRTVLSKAIAAKAMATMTEAMT